MQAPCRQTHAKIVQQTVEQAIQAHDYESQSQGVVEMPP